MNSKLRLFSLVTVILSLVGVIPENQTLLDQLFPGMVFNHHFFFLLSQQGLSWPGSFTMETQPTGLDDKGPFTPPLYPAALSLAPGLSLRHGSLRDSLKLLEAVRIVNQSLK